MKHKVYSLVVAALFSIIAILHALRIARGWEAAIGDVTIPMWASWIAVFVAGFLAKIGWNLAKKHR
ncbi:MAG: hypothetical protein AAB784_03255 [Patescibacteria group bacterium]